MGRWLIGLLSSLALSVTLSGCGSSSEQDAALSSSSDPEPSAGTSATDAENPAVRDATATTAAADNWKPQKLDAPHLPNAYRLHEKVLSGGQPEGDAAFQELQALGVKTVISVDGARPDVDLAKKYGLRYVHLPHGYDGVPEQRVKELARAVRDLPGPVYIHCHHGKHRSPAAATVACVSTGLLSSSQALVVLKAAGTSEHYRGLYQSAESARLLESHLLDELTGGFPEIAALPPMAEAMVSIEHHFDHLKKFAAGNWKLDPEHPALTPAHEALLLREQYTELLRTDEVRKKPEEYQRILRDGEAAALELESLLRNESPDNMTAKKAAAVFSVLTLGCSACHKTFRDVPLSEKK